MIAHYNRITPPRPRSEASARPERPTKVQTFGFLLEGAMTKRGVCRRPDAGTGQLFTTVLCGIKLYRADIVHAHDDIICAEDMDWSEDLYFNLSYIRYAEKFYALSTPIYNYYNTPGSAVHTVLNPVNIVSTRATLFAYYKELYENLGAVRGSISRRFINTWLLWRRAERKRGNSHGCTAWENYAGTRFADRMVKRGAGVYPVAGRAFGRAGGCVGHYNRTGRAGVVGWGRSRLTYWRVTRIPRSGRD